MLQSISAGTDGCAAGPIFDNASAAFLRTSPFLSFSASHSAAAASFAPGPIFPKATAAF